MKHEAANEAATARVQTLRRLALFQELSDAQLQEIAAASYYVPLARGALLFQKGDAARGFYVVVQGQIKLAFASATGAEKIVELLGPGQSFGEALMFMNRPYPVFSQAVIDSTVIAIRQEPLLRLLDGEAGFARAMLAGLSRKLHSIVQDVEDYTTRSSAQRLIGYLLRHADEVQSGPVEILLPANRENIASRLNVAPETLSRIFKDLVDRGMISVDRRRVFLPDIARLRTFEG